MTATARLARLLAAVAPLLLRRAAADPSHRYHRTERPDPDRAAVPFRVGNESDVGACSDNSAEGTCDAPGAPGARYCLRTNSNAGYYLYGSRNCFHDEPLSAQSLGHFVSPTLGPGDVWPFLWRDSGKIATQYALQVGIPSTLTSALWEYADELGVPDLLKEYTSSTGEESEDEGERGEFFSSEGRTSQIEMWYLRYPPTGQGNNLHSVGAADESTHEEFLRTLAAGGLDSILEVIGSSLGTDSLAVYHVAFEGVSTGSGEQRQVVGTNTRGGAYKLLLPLSLESDGLELVLWDDGRAEGGNTVGRRTNEKNSRRGGWRPRVGTGVLLGDGAYHTVGKVGNNETETTTGMHLFAAIYVAEIYQDSVEAIAEQTLTQAFPQRDGHERAWILANGARHWHKEGSTSLAGDAGRRAFRSDDESEECDDLAEEDGGCEHLPTRLRCPLSCNVYVREGPTKVEGADEDDAVRVCIQNRTGEQTCQVYADNPSIGGDFVTPKLEPGELFPFVWRDDRMQAVPYAFLVGLPPELTSTLLGYCDELGITKAMRELTGDEPLEPGTNNFVELSDGNDWYVQRPPAKWTSNMHWISPGDETTHEEYLKVLARGRFDVVLDAIGSYLGLESLAAYHLTFIGVSHSEKGFMHRDTHHTGASVYNVIIPLILEDDTPELAMADDMPPYEVGALKYRLGTAAMMGDDSMHGTEACDYRTKKGMRLAATVYIADIKPSNAKKIATQTLTQIFPMRDDRWLLAQAGRHWDGNGAIASLAEDKGRGPFEVEDQLEDCEERAAEGLCYVDDGGEKGFRTRRSCLKSCGVYEADDERKENDADDEKEE